MKGIAYYHIRGTGGIVLRGRRENGRHGLLPARMKATGASLCRRLLDRQLNIWHGLLLALRICLVPGYGEAVYYVADKVFDM